MTPLKNRREILKLGAGLGLLGLSLRGQSGPLPLNTTGLEHVGMTVNDPEATAKFYGRVFDPQLFKEREIPNRFYVRTGIAYLAFGITDPDEMQSIDHFCALVQNYGANVRTAITDAGIPMGASPLSMPADPDGIRLQLLNVPGGLAGSIIPGGRISQEEPAVEAVGIDHIMLAVTDLEAADKFWGIFFGDATRQDGRLWYQVANTRLGLQRVATGEQPRIHHLSFRVAGFDRSKASDKIAALGGKIVDSGPNDPLMFQDPNGFLIGLRSSVTSVVRRGPC